MTTKSSQNWFKKHQHHKDLNLNFKSALNKVDLCEADVKPNRLIQL